MGATLALQWENNFHCVKELTDVALNFFSAAPDESQHTCQKVASGPNLIYDLCDKDEALGNPYEVCMEYEKRLAKAVSDGTIDDFKSVKQAIEFALRVGNLVSATKPSVEDEGFGILCGRKKGYKDSTGKFFPDMVNGMKYPIHSLKSVAESNAEASQAERMVLLMRTELCKASHERLFVCGKMDKNVCNAWLRCMCEGQSTPESSIEGWGLRSAIQWEGGGKPWEFRDKENKRYIGKHINELDPVDAVISTNSGHLYLADGHHRLLWVTTEGSGNVRVTFACKK